MSRIGSQLSADPCGGVERKDGIVGRGVDNTRLREELGFEPAYDAAGAVEDLARASAGLKIGPSLHPGALAGRLIGADR